MEFSRWRVLDAPETVKQDTALWSFAIRARRPLAYACVPLSVACSKPRMRKGSSVIGTDPRIHALRIDVSSVRAFEVTNPGGKTRFQGDQTRPHWRLVI